MPKDGTSRVAIFAVLFIATVSQSAPPPATRFPAIVASLRGALATKQSSSCLGHDWIASLRSQ
jgi:hypothetical protein